MKCTLNSLFMKNFGIAMMAVIVLTFCSSSSALKRNQPNDTIVGTWISDPGGSTKWVFTDDSKLKTYYNDELDKVFTYELSKSPIQCGVNMQDRLQRYPDESILILTNTQSEKKRCYLVYGFDNINLGIRLFGSSNMLNFKRQ